ncbi:hypothetical protein [uncultured Brevundimonas sp.]|uniref:hypothetical protein n=1 Tax=uncultured Brevundimonas sp. TaxID=213418 RepID=UPI0026294A59|nr:hypothetical protein [uncultured Brevundimonas sp.]
MTIKSNGNTKYNIDRDTPLSLKTVAELFFPDGSITRNKLKKKVEDGLLVAWDIGGELLTSRVEVERMLEKCRVTPSRLDYGIASPDPKNREEVQKKGPTTSSITDAKLARDAAVMTAQRLRQSLRSS